MLDLFSFMRQALAGRFTSECTHYNNFSQFSVYCGRDFQFTVTVDDKGFTIKEASGVFMCKGSTFVEYAQFLKDSGRLNSGFEV